MTQFTISLLVLILTIESVYKPYLYDNGHGDEEHCCLVRVRENLCLASPITRSLIQVNKQCHRYDRVQTRRTNGKKDKHDSYVDQITRRLEIQNVHEDEKKIFIELQKPLEKHILDKDLICLTSTTRNINLEKCHVEMLENDHPISRRKYKRRKPRNQVERSVVKTEETDAIDDETKNEMKHETHRIELTQPIRIREGRGLSLLRKYQIDLNSIQLNTRQEHLCWNWYRKQTRKIRRNPTKYSKSCIKLNYRREQCFNQFLHNSMNTTAHSQLSFSGGSKLYCENQDGYSQFLALYRRSELCFYSSNETSIEHQFTDIAGISDLHQNKDSLEFIANDSKLTAEFEDDCHGKSNLVEQQ